MLAAMLATICGITKTVFLMICCVYAYQAILQLIDCAKYQVIGTAKFFIYVFLLLINFWALGDIVT